MKITDYSRIADSYDDAAIRHRIPTDPFLAHRLAGAEGPFAVLDVACGTGNYLAVQRAAHPEERITWYGVDLSAAMLDRARQKLPGIEWSEGSAESLPFDESRFDYVTCSFAFHHFPHKARALDEMVRVLTPSGAIRIANIVPEHMRGWWLYRYFPEAVLEDEQRFWTTALLFRELAARGLSPSADISVRLTREPADELYRQAEKRDISELAILTDAEHAAGLEKLARDADRGTLITTEEAVLVCTATCSRKT